MRGHLTKKGERWYAVVSLKATANRKRRQRWIRLNARTKRGAETGLAKIVVQVEDRGLPENTKTTIAAHLDYWFGISAPKFSGKTRQRFAAIIGSYLKPTLGEIQLSKLSTQLVDEAYADWEKTGNKTEGLRKNGSKWRSAAAGTGLSPASIHAIHHVLHAALEFAVAKDLILKNVAAKAELPDLEHREMAVLNEQEVAQLLEAAYGSHLYVPVFLAVNTAVRRGELLGLRWADVDFERRQLTVRRSLEELKGALSFKSPKTDEARSIRLDDYTTALLKKHRAEQIELRLGLGLGHSGSDLVFAGPRGEPWRPSTLTHDFAKLISRSGVPRIRLHDLRHTCASLMLAQGADINSVSKRLGHSKVSTTLDVYAHAYERSQQEAANKLGASIAEAVLEHRREASA